MSDGLTRRDFLIASAAAAAAGTACAGNPAPGTSAAASAGTARHTAPGTVLFQGDSITDAGRGRTNPAPNNGGALGTGYPLLVAAAVLRDAPDPAWRFLNRGISGNRVPDLQARWDADTLALEPDVLSILIGVNDYWHMRRGTYTGTAADYESQYAALLDATRRALPTTRFVVMEPFVLVTGAVDASWHPDFDQRRAAARRVAERAGATWVALQDALDAAAARTGPAYWLSDGVHPTPAGHELIAERWRAATGI
jgi:lysophospholipase L1-like esterase